MRPRSGARDGSRALAARMIFDAVNDMRDLRQQSEEELRQERKAGSEGSGPRRLSSTVWLGSSRARFWFEVARIDQRAGLKHVGWPHHARELLLRDIRSGERAVLEMGINALSEFGG
jgi:hypothetical protein